MVIMLHINVILFFYLGSPKKLGFIKKRMGFIWFFDFESKILHQFMEYNIFLEAYSFFLTKSNYLWITQVLTKNQDHIKSTDNKSIVVGRNYLDFQI